MWMCIFSILNWFPFWLQLLCKCSVARVNCISFVCDNHCGTTVWLLILLISEWSIKDFDWKTLSHRRIEKPRTRLPEISPISLKNKGEEEWRCSASEGWGLQEETVSSAGLRDYCGWTEKVPPTVSSVCNFCKDDGHCCPPSHLPTSPGLCCVMNGGPIVHLCPTVDLEMCQAKIHVTDIKETLSVSVWRSTFTIFMINKLFSLFHSDIDMLLCILLSKSE